MRRRKPGITNVKTNTGSEIQTQDQFWQTFMNTMTQRSVLALRATGSQMGITHNGTRDIYSILGYKRELVFDDYFWRYERQDIATRVVTAFPSAVWSMNPRIHESETPDAETPFEVRLEEIIRRNRVFHYLSRADKISGIGRFGIIVLGFDDNRSLKMPVAPRDGMNLIYMRPYHEGSVKISQYDSDTRSERYGQPLMYKVDTSIPEVANTSQLASTTTEPAANELEVHWTRVIHVLPELATENDIFATPRLKNVYNRLQDIDLIAGGSSEMFWRGAFQGFAFKNDADAEMSPQDKAGLDEEINKYVNNFQRYLKLQNIDVKELNTQVADPKNHFDIQMTLIAAARGIPKRILLGSERGELASNQDENNWIKRVDERRVDHAELLILRPFIDRLIEFGVLPDPGQPYTVEWPDLYSASDEDQANVAEAKMRALKDYLMLSGDQVIPVDVFLEQEMRYSSSVIQRCLAAFEGIMTEEQNDINNDINNDSENSGGN